MSVGDLVERAILNADPATLGGRMRLKAAIAARRALVRLGDPVVTYRVGSVAIELPLSHELPFYRHAHPLYDTRIGTLAAELGGPVVDVGANVGDTAAAIRARTDVPVLCVEGDERFFALLERNAARLGDVELERAFVDAPERGRVERAAGTARVVAGDGALRSRTLGDVLASHPRFAAPALVKLDTDGMDVPIVLANLELLARLRPVLFLEYDPHLGAAPEVFSRLAAAGYGEAEWYENTGEHVATVTLPEHLHDRYLGHGGGRYADVLVRPR
jgi:FkbM family methyltransferase